MVGMRWVALALLLAVPVRAQFDPSGEGWKSIVLNHWGGLNLLQDSTMIDGDAQAAMNVLTDNTYLEKRPGNVRLATILPGYAVQYVNDWSAPNGSRYLIAQASSTIYQTNFSGAPVALSTVAVGFNITTVAAFSRLEFADGFRPLWYWNDSTTATVTDGASGSPAPICTYIAFKDSRIWCANLPDGFSETGNTTNGGGSSTVLISSAGGDGYWAVPFDVGQVDSVPNRFDFNPDDGDEITCLQNTPWGMFVGKRNSSYIVKGNGNLSYDPRLLDPKIGCVDNRSVQMVYGVLEWLAVDGVYGYDGSGPPHILTRELDPLMATVRESSFSQGQWATQLQSDWAAGTQSTTTLNLPPLPWDYNSLPGEIFPSSGTLYDDNTSPQLQTCSTNLNPDNGLPWSCGVGFSSDTLVNIDTTSVPLSIGLAQIGQSASLGILISSATTTTMATAFPVTAAQLRALNPGWIALEGNMSASADCLSGVGLCGDSGEGLGYHRNSIFSVPSSTGSQQPSGMMYGTWSMDWFTAGSATSGECVNGGAGECLEMDFINTLGPTTGAQTTGYDIEVDEVSGASYALTLNKNVAGVKTSLGSYPFTWPSTTVNIGVSRTPGGQFTVYYGAGGATGSGVPVFQAQDFTSSISSNVATSIVLYSQAVGGVGDFSVSCLGFKFQGNTSTGSIVSRIIDTGAAAPLAGVLSSSYTLQGAGNQTELDFYVRDSTSPNNDLWSSWQASSNNVLAVLPERYWQYEALFTSRVSSYTPQLASVELDAVTTGYYYSRVDFIGNLITSWRQFGVTEDNPGTYGYAVRSATYAFLPSATIPWTTQTANQNVAVATGAYAQFRLDSTPLASNPDGASAAEPISAVFLRWDQGADLPVASSTLERRYMLCVTISTAATAPDLCLIRQKTGKWVPWTTFTTIGAMGLYNNQMVAADGGTSSKVWEIMQPNIYEDDGQPINAMWTSADETYNLVFNNKIYHEAWVDAQPVQGSSVTYSYAVSKSSGFVDQPFSLDNGQPLDPSLPVMGSQYGDINQWLPPVSGYDTGKYLRVKFSNDTLDEYFRINSYMLWVEPQVRMTP